MKEGERGRKLMCGGGGGGRRGGNGVIDCHVLTSPVAPFRMAKEGSDPDQSGLLGIVSGQGIDGRLWGGRTRVGLNVATGQERVS